jgi:hypothetical protein
LPAAVNLFRSSEREAACTTNVADEGLDQGELGGVPSEEGDPMTLMTGAKCQGGAFAADVADPNFIEIEARLNAGEALLLADTARITALEGETIIVANAPVNYLSNGGAYITDDNWHTLDAGINLIVGAQYLITVEYGVVTDIGMFHIRSVTPAEQAALVGTDYGLPFYSSAPYELPTGAARLRLSIRRIQGAVNGYKVILSRTDT